MDQYVDECSGKWLLGGILLHLAIIIYLGCETKGRRRKIDI